MRHALQQYDGIVVSRRSRGGSGLVRQDWFNWVWRAAEYVHTDRPDIVIVSLGGNDRQDLRFGGVTLERFSKAWWAEYARRAERVMLDLRASGSTVYWVGIPIVRSQRMMHDYRKLNGLFRHMSSLYGVHYVDLDRQLRGPDLHYTPFETANGTRERIRERDGIHFTGLGNLRLAQIIVDAMWHRLTSGH